MQTFTITSKHPHIIGQFKNIISFQLHLGLFLLIIKGINYVSIN